MYPGKERGVIKDMVVRKLISFSFSDSGNLTEDGIKIALWKIISLILMCTYAKCKRLKSVTSA